MSSILSFAKFILFIYFFLYAVYHLIVIVNPTFVRFLVFQNHVNFPFRNLTDPTQHGLNNVYNFYFDSEKDVRIGVWHFIPKPFEYNPSKDASRNMVQHFEAYLKNYDDRPIVIYVHGNDRDRGEYGRIQMCKVLNDLGYHVFALDYRGYGDSTGIPTETGVVNDVVNLQNFIKSYQSKAQIHLWGHSLGTGIATHAAKVLSEFNAPPKSLVLEAPFKNIKQASEEYIIAPLFLNNKWIVSKTREALDAADIHFKTDENLLQVKSKVLIVHAEDDWFIPQDHSRELLKLCQEKRPRDYPPVKLVEIEKKHQLGHLKLYSHKEIIPTLKNFIEGQ